MSEPSASVSSSSPTGTPMLPPAVVPWLALALPVLNAIALSLPEHTVAAKILLGVSMSLGGVLGIASPGWRKQ